MKNSRFAFTLILCFATMLSFGASVATAANPYSEEVGNLKGTASTSGGKPGPETLAPSESSTPKSGTGTAFPTPPGLEAPPNPGAKGVTTGSPEFKSWLKSAQPQIDAWNFPEGIVNKYGQIITRHDFLKAIIWIESNGVHKGPSGKVTTSYVGALGFMQLMPATAKSLGCNPKDPKQNLLAGTKYIKEIFNADCMDGVVKPEEKLIKAVCAYNAGPYSSFAKRTWDKLKLGKNYETIGYGLKLKMCLGLELSTAEKVLVTRVFDCKYAKVDSLIDEYYSNSNGLF